MRNAEIILSIIQKRGQHKLPVKDAYRLLYQKDIYLKSYAKLYRNEGAMTEGMTSETIDGMSMEKIDNIINALRYERYRWTPVKRVYIPKKNSKTKLRPLGLPIWSDKLLQEVIRTILEAYYEPNFSEHSHGFRPQRGCHTALKEVTQKGQSTKWFIETDISACFDKIDHKILLSILEESFQDNRFISLISELLKAGYLENWKFNRTFSGVPQGSVIGPILSNIVLDRLDKYVEQELIPVYTCGKQRKENSSYRKLSGHILKLRKAGLWQLADKMYKQMQTMPSKDTTDPNFRRLWYVRYADDSLLGLSGPRDEALVIKQKITEFLNNKLKLTLNAEKTLITHACSQKAKFLGYELHTLQENSKHDFNGRRSINGRIGLLVPYKVKQEKCNRYMQSGKPKRLSERTINDAYSIVSQYQAEYRGIVQYYSMAYNLHTLNYLKYVMEMSLAKTLANKYKTTCAKIYKRFGTSIETKYGRRKVLLVKRDREQKEPLITYFGGIPLKRNKEAKISELPIKVWNHRTELIQRLEAQKCELCGSTEKVEVHHIRKLADLEKKGRKTKSVWEKQMIARRRKTLIVCQMSMSMKIVPPVLTKIVPPINKFFYII